jgi:isopenicillin N synthase-like dioxygenase
LDDDESLPFLEDEMGRALRRRLKRYFVECQRLAARLAELLALSLGLPRTFFALHIDRSNDSLRAHWYPGSSDLLANDQGMGAHTDGSLLSLLTQTAPGIQIRPASGDWLSPNVRALDQFIVNIGDLMSHWSNRQYLSTEHRVLLSRRERQSIVFFKLTNEDVLVELGNKQMDALFGRD